MKDRKKTIIFYVIIILICAIKLYLVKGLQINALYEATYDDTLMIDLANNIINGKWLGEYNCLTLIKGAFTPLFLVVLYYLKIPFLIGQELFYLIACVLFILVIKKKINNKAILTIIFLVMVFNPITYSINLCRVYRDGIYTSLIIYLITFIFAIFLNRKEKTSKLIKYFIGLGMAVTAVSTCREETLWILPFVIISSFITILFIFKQTESLKQKIYKIILYIIPIIILSVTILVICILNYKYYGVFTTNQYWGKEFKQAYGAITRVIPEKKKNKIPVTKETMNRIYEISPKFKELQQFFESEEGRAWELCGNGGFGEIQGGWFHWALIRAVESKGYYVDAQTANKYYRELANEINNAIDNKEIEGLDKKRVTNSPVLYIEDIPKIIEKSENVFKFQYTLYFIKVNKTSMGIPNELESVKKDFEKVTSTKIDDTNIKNTQKQILNTILNIYKKINPYLFYLSIIIYVIITIIFIIRPKQYYEEFLILSGLLVVYLSRIAVISYTAQQMYATALNEMYLSSIYVVQYLFGILGIIFCTKISRDAIKNKKGTNIRR